MTALRLVAVLVVACMPAAAYAQETQRTPQAVVEDLRAHGEITEPDLFLFRGCPQEDPVGRAVFEAVSREALDPDGLVSLATAWVNQYSECAYEPLADWYVSAFNEIAEQRHGRAALGFTFVLRNTETTDDMQEALLRSAEDERWAGGIIRPELASRAIHNRPEAQQVREAVRAFRRNLPEDWIHSEATRLGRMFGPAFFSEVLREAPGLDDSVMNSIASAVAEDLRAGRVEDGSSELAGLRAYLRERPGIAPRNRIPESSSR